MITALRLVLYRVILIPKKEKTGKLTRRFQYLLQAQTLRLLFLNRQVQIVLFTIMS